MPWSCQKSAGISQFRYHREQVNIVHLHIQYFRHCKNAKQVESRLMYTLNRKKQLITVHHANKCNSECKCHNDIITVVPFGMLNISIWHFQIEFISKMLKTTYRPAKTETTYTTKLEEAFRFRLNWLQKFNTGRYGTILDPNVWVIGIQRRLERTYFNQTVFFYCFKIV